MTSTSNPSYDTGCVLQMASPRDQSGGDSSKGNLLGAAERKYYTDMCNQLFRKYATIKARNGGGKRSQIWKCFIPTNSAAICKLCKASVKCGSTGNTTNLTAHMQRRHHKEFSEMVETETIKEVPAVYNIVCLLIGILSWQKSISIIGAIRILIIFICQHAITIH